MPTLLARRAHAVDRATADDRDRLIDLLRVAAMLTVAVGHWLAAAVTITPSGTVTATNTLGVVPATRWLTLGMQVMGLFFATSAWSSARTLRRLDGGSRGARDWYLARLRRIAAPTGVYVAAWAVLAGALAARGPSPLVTTIGQLVAIQLWFVAVIVLMFAMTPPLHRLWSRYGMRLPIVLTLLAVAVDAAHRIAGVPLIGWANYVLVWSVPTVLGFAWHDGALTATRRRAPALLAGGSVALAALVASPWLPLSMVGVPGATQSNNSPPSVALIALTCVHLGAVLLAAGWLRRWLARPRVWLAVVTANLTAMTTYLWHLTALVVLAGLLRLGDGTAWFGAVGSGRWWATRPVWLAVLAVLTVPLVAALKGIERAPLAACTAGWARLVVATVGLVAGAALLAQHGFVSATGPLAVVAVLGAVTSVRAWPPFPAPDRAQTANDAAVMRACQHRAHILRDRRGARGEGPPRHGPGASSTAPAAHDGAGSPGGSMLRPWDTSRPTSHPTGSDDASAPRDGASVSVPSPGTASGSTG